MTPAEFQTRYGVSRETLDKLTTYDALLVDWSTRQNLIARSTIEDRWARHFADSAQLKELLPPGAKTLYDLGAGAGFPGLVLAAMGDADGLSVTLVESTGKKAAFLRAAATAMRLDNVVVEGQRIESMAICAPDVITARALANLPKLCAYAFAIAGKNTVCIFPKGQDVEGELTEAAKYWHMDVEKVPSRTNSDSTILVIKRLAPKGA